MVGWWFHDRAPDQWPLPQRLVGGLRRRERDAVLRHLRAGRRVASWLQPSYCRFACGERSMGRADVSDGTFVWPSGLAHYVERHHVRLPPWFVAQALERRTVAPGVMPVVGAGSYDVRPWLQWARSERACLDFTGWARPTLRDHERIASVLPRRTQGLPVLWRAATREVVLVLRGGSLAVHSLQTGGGEPRRLDGWHAWPGIASPRRRAAKS